MAATMKFGELETVVRRDLVKDDDTTQYRWSSFQILAAINRAVRDVVNANAWAEYDQETCRRIYPTYARNVVRYCEADPASLASTTSYVVDGNTYTTDQYLAYVRALTVPVDERWHDAVAYYAAYHVLDTAGADAELRRRSLEFLQVARENASK